MISSFTVAVKWQLVRHMLHRCSEATVAIYSLHNTADTARDMATWQ